jgi:hypothetical protein
LSKKDKSTRPFTVSILKYLNDARKIWLNPEYQRESVWTRSQQQLLIDSLFREIDIPKIYFREIEKDSYVYEVVDGQQRLRAIYAFMSDSFKMPSDADDVDSNAVGGRRFSELATELQMKFQNAPLDVVVMNSEYTDDDIEEIFLRLQNGTSLNAAEKRRAIAGRMREVVAGLSRHKAFGLCGFQDKRYAYEDAIAKLMHLFLSGVITDIRPASIRHTYEKYSTIAGSQEQIKRLKKALNFIAGAFKDKQSPMLKKYAVITLGYLTAEMIDEYDLTRHGDEFAECYLNFEANRITNEELPEEDQDSALAAYTDAARSDSIQDMRYRHELLKRHFVASIPTLVLKDPMRPFSDEQRMAIYRKNKGVCQVCGISCEESDFHADHIVPHSKGGRTAVVNGQVLCPKDNLMKGDRE